MFGEAPTPAVPPVPFASAVRDGWAASLLLEEAAIAAAGLSTAVGEVAAGAAATARDGAPLAASCGLSVGTLLA
jgi:hypothetical protein